MAKKKKTPAKKTAITKDKKTLSHVKNAANSSQMKRLLDAVGGLDAITGITPAAKRGLRRDLGFGSTPSRRSRKVVAAAYVGPPQREWQFAPDRLRPPRPEPAEFRGGFACPCCARQSGSPFFIIKRKARINLIARSGPLRDKPSGVYSKPYDSKRFNMHLTDRHGFPSQRSKSKKASSKSRPASGMGRGEGSANLGGGQGGQKVNSYVEVWVWVYGKGWEVQKVLAP